MSLLWTTGEPKESGYYLVLVRMGGHPQGNPWPFLANVFVDDREVPDHSKVGFGRPVYLDHFSGDDRWRKYPGGHVVGYCEATPENFGRALAEVKDFYVKATQPSQTEET